MRLAKAATFCGLFSCCLFAPSGLDSQNAERPNGGRARLDIQNLERREGYIPMLWDAEQGKLYFELTRS